MLRSLSGDDISRYRESGYLPVPGLLSAGELRDCRKAADEAWEATRRESADDAESPKRQRQRSMNIERRNVWRSDDSVRSLLLGSALGELAADLLGSAAARLYFDRMLRKPGFGTATPFHIDGGHWAFDDPGVTVWIALDDVDATNGCMYYYPGSHRRDRRSVKQVGPGIGAFLEHCPELREAQPVACSLPAGGAVFHHSLTVHGAGANMSPRPRRALTVAMMPAGATYNGRRFLVSDAFRPGDPLAGDDNHPVPGRVAARSEHGGAA